MNSEVIRYAITQNCGANGASGTLISSIASFECEQVTILSCKIACRLLLKETSREGREAWCTITSSAQKYNSSLFYFADSLMLWRNRVKGQVEGQGGEWLILDYYCRWIYVPVVWNNSRYVPYRLQPLLNEVKTYHPFKRVNTHCSCASCQPCDIFWTQSLRLHTH